MGFLRACFASERSIKKVWEYPILKIDMLIMGSVMIKETNIDDVKEEQHHLK